MRETAIAMSISLAPSKLKAGPGSIEADPSTLSDANGFVSPLITRPSGSMSVVAVTPL
jgi:hypothetical protein